MVVHSALEDVFLDINAALPAAGINADYGGCTAVVALMRGLKVWVANAGDSRAVVAGRGKDGGIVAHGLTRDQVRLCFVITVVCRRKYKQYVNIIYIYTGVYIDLRGLPRPLSYPLKPSKSCSLRARPSSEKKIRVYIPDCRPTSKYTRMYQCTYICICVLEYSRTLYYSRTWKYTHMYQSAEYI